MEEAPPLAPPSNGADDQARFLRLHRRMAGLRMLLLVLLPLLYLVTGASRTLAEGVEHRFENAWWWSHLAYLGVTLLGLAVFMSPLAWFENVLLGRLWGDPVAAEDDEDHEGEWILDHGRQALFDGLTALVYFMAVYALLRYWPGGWWLGAAGCYLAVCVGVDAAPAFYGDLDDDLLQPLPEGDLRRELTSVLDRCGLRVRGLYRTGEDIGLDADGLAISGFGSRRRVFVPDQLPEAFTVPELKAMLAHEAAHHRSADHLRALGFSGLLLTAGFFLVDRLASVCFPLPGLRGLGDPAAFPLLAVSLFAVTLCHLPLLNLYTRWREYRADAFAIRIMEGPRPLLEALGKLAGADGAGRPGWSTALLEASPSVARRIAHIARRERGHRTEEPAHG